MRFIRGGEKELLEKLGRNDPCPCGSTRSFQTLLHGQRLLSMAAGAMTISADQRLGIARPEPGATR
ncbi:SEC-C metal-binding domain-containing protein [Chitiniphilus eburneus]|nr:SEC-C metal-binding domain-containing protein [Chitiniphilus eburneus]